MEKKDLSIIGGERERHRRILWYILDGFFFKNTHCHGNHDHGARACRCDNIGKVFRESGPLAIFLGTRYFYGAARQLAPGKASG